MATQKSRRFIYWGAAAIVALAVGVGCFLGAHTLLADDPEVRAKPREPFWYAPYFDEDFNKPRFNQVINGILVGPTAREPSSGLCMEIGVEPHYVPPERAVGTVLDFNPSYLPEGVQLSRPWTPAQVVDCGGTIVSVSKEYYIPNKPSAEDPNFPAWAGGSLFIRRFLTTRSDSFPLEGPAERFGPITIAGRRGVLMRPVMPDGVDVGMDHAIILIPEDFGFTIVNGLGLPLGEIVKIAEGLYGEGKP
ncbi:MAG: hypothetical protein ACUVV3_10200 [Dehalococcoidia bacterium]